MFWECDGCLDRFDTSSFADKILAASSLASEGSEGEVEFAFAEKMLDDPAMEEKMLKYAEQHSREGFGFDGCLNIKETQQKSSGRISLLTGAPDRPLEEKIRDTLVFLSAMGQLEELVQYVLVHVKPRRTGVFYTQLEESKDMDHAVRERLGQLESKWAELSSLGRQLVTVTFLIENDNSYEIEIEEAEPPLKGKEAKAREIMNEVFQSRLRLVRSFVK